MAEVTKQDREAAVEALDSARGHMDDGVRASLAKFVETGEDPYRRWWDELAAAQLRADAVAELRNTLAQVAKKWRWKVSMLIANDTRDTLNDCIEDLEDAGLLEKQAPKAGG